MTSYSNSAGYGAYGYAIGIWKTASEAIMVTNHRLLEPDPEPQERLKKFFHFRKQNSVELDKNVVNFRLKKGWTFYLDSKEGVNFLFKNALSVPVSHCPLCPPFSSLPHLRVI